ncbi:MAG: oligosaccharide flippase family protein [Bacteroidales bacterium]|nr:oligosaccharide flippase family protein [Bacteroidales bacterium]
MKKKFITNLAFLLFLNILIKPVYAFGIDVGIQNAVGAISYGSYFILLNFTLIFQIILDLGIENYSRREIARSPGMLGRYFSGIMPLKLILGCIYFAVCYTIGSFLGWVKQEFMMLTLLLFNQFLAGFILYLRSNLGGLHMFRLESLISILDKLIVILICGFLLLNPLTRIQFRIEWLVFAQTAAYLIVAALAFLIVFMNSGDFQFNFNPGRTLIFLKRSFPYALLIMLMAIYTRSNSVLLGILRSDGKELAGIYAQSFRIVEILTNYGYLFTIILLPVFSRLLKQNEPVADLLQLSARLLFVPAIVMVCGCIAYRNEIISLLYVEHTEISGRVFGILIGSFLGMCTTYSFGTLLTANGSLLQLNKMAFISVILYLVLNLVLICEYGVIGAALAHVATQLFTAVYQIILAVQIFHFRIHYSLLTRLAIFFLVVLGVAVLMENIDMNWYLSFFLFVIFALMFSFLTKLLQIKSLLFFVQNEKYLK